MFRSIDIGVDKANAILRVEPMDIDGEELSPEREDITLSHVDFSYDSKPILHDVSLTIPEKTTVAIVGPSGSGKTTLCNLMARFWDVQGRQRAPWRTGCAGVQLRQPHPQFLLRVPAGLSVLGHHRQQYPLRKARRLHGGGAGRCEKRRGATTLSWHCRTALTPSSAKAALRFPAANVSAFPSRGPL